MRIDKYLWAVRIFKTRALATEACKKGRVLVNDAPAKASRDLSGNEIVKVRHSPIWRHYQIKSLLASRVAGRLVADYLEDITPQQELDKLEELKSGPIKRDRGAGRPSKKERRDMDKFREI